MQRLATFALVLAAVLAAAFVLATAGALPDVVATHFGASGAADTTVPRSQYIIGATLLVALVPLFVGGGISLLARRANYALNMPNRAYWFAPERRSATIEWLTLAGCWLGVGIAMFLAGAHGLVLEAHSSNPPQLSQSLMLGWMGFVIAATLVWTVAFLVRFRRPRAAD